MKRYTLLLLVVLCMVGCKKSNTNTALIAGEIKGLTTDTLFLYGADGWYDRVDTIVAVDGKFSHEVQLDTTSYALLSVNNHVEYPLFLEKGADIHLSGTAQDITRLSVVGGALNAEYDAFKKELQALGKPSDAVIQNRVEAFIKGHPSSLVNLYLMEKYVVQKDPVDFDHVNRLMALMSGPLRDTPRMEQIADYATTLSNASVGKYAYYFNLPDIKGEYVTRVSDLLKSKTLLINFWASWADSTAHAKACKELRTLHKKYKTNKSFAMLGVSFDVDKEVWKQAVKQDSLAWKQVWDRAGMNAELAKKLAITKLPATLILSPDGKILARNLWGEELKRELEKILVDSKKDKKTK